MIEDQSGTKYSWQKGNYAAIGEAIRRVDWNFNLAFKSANDCFHILKMFLMSLIERFVPLSRNNAETPWRVHPPKSLKQLKRNSWEAYRKVRGEHG